MRNVIILITTALLFCSCLKSGLINPENRTPPLPPESLSLKSSTPNQVDLTWKDLSPNELGFKIERKKNNESFVLIQTTVPDVQSYQDKTTTAGNTYTYRIIAFNKKGNSLPSNEATIKTEDPAVALLRIGLLAYYPFAGNAIDSSGNNLNGSVFAATLTADRFNRSNNAYNFNGISSYIQLPLLQALNSLSTASFSFWVRNITSNQGAIIGHWGNSNGGVGVNAGFVVGHSSGSITASNYSGCCAPTSSRISSNSSWNHVVVVYESSRVNFYINGILSNSVSGKLNTIIGSATSSFIGRRNTDFNRFGDYFGGQIDDVRIYRKALSLQEIIYLSKN